MSIVEILNNKLCPDITNIIFDYNMPRKEDISFLKLRNTLDMKTIFYRQFGRKIIKEKYYDVLINNKRKLYKQHDLLDDVLCEFSSLLYAFIDIEKGYKKTHICDTNIDLVRKKKNNNIEVRAYKNNKLHKSSNNIQNIFKIYLKYISDSLKK